MSGTRAMNVTPRADNLRRVVSEQLDLLQQLVSRRNLLLHLAGTDPQPAVARALRANRELAEAVRIAARRARAQLADLERDGN